VLVVVALGLAVPAVPAAAAIPGVPPHQLINAGATLGHYSFAVGAEAATPEDPATGGVWADPATRVEWDLDTTGAGQDNYQAVFFHDSAGLHGEIHRLADGAKTCNAPATFDGRFYRLDAPAWCIGSPTAATMSATFTASDAQGLSVSRFPTQGETPSSQSNADPPPGYWMVGADGTVYPFGSAQAFTDAGNQANSGPAPTATPAVGLAPFDRGTGGYTLLYANGQTRCYGASFMCGTPVALHPGERATGIANNPDLGAGENNRYWIFTSEGRALGNSTSLGDMSGVKLNGPVLGGVATPSGRGYYMVASDGGIFTFGDATFEGSMGGRPLNAPVEGLVPNQAGPGYWLVASDGGIFAFGGAPFRGSLGATKLNKPIIGMVAYGDGYLMVASDGGIFDFSDLPFAGSLGANPPRSPITSVTAVPQA